jgi:hypothetical protein
MFHNVYSRFPEKDLNKLCSEDLDVRTDRMLLSLALVFLVATLFLTGLSFRISDSALRVQTMLYATYIFITGVAMLVIIEVVHLAKREFSKPH